MSRFRFETTPLAGLMAVHRLPLGDERGWFSRFFCAEEFAAHGWTQPVAQINQSMTRRPGAVRGLHLQLPPHAEMKLVSCLRGSVFDVAVDVRRGSPTFLAWHGQVLSAENQASLLIPAGFAHGFQALESDCELLYLHSAAHAPEAEAALHVLDPALAISWPMDIAELSPRDRAHARLTAGYPGVSL